jgi:hypothetical protein
MRFRIGGSRSCWRRPLGSVTVSVRSNSTDACSPSTVRLTMRTSTSSAPIDAK